MEPTMTSYRLTSQRPTAHRLAARQRGMSLLGMLLVAFALGLVALVALRLWSPVMEYITIKQVVQQIARTQTTSATDTQIAAAFDKRKSVEYSIVTIEGRDLEVDRETGVLKISFAYDKVVDFIGPVYLLVKFRGES